MTEHVQSSLWNHLDDLADPELAALVDSAITVLESGARAAAAGESGEGEDDGESVKSLPPGALAQALQAALAEQGIATGAAAATLVSAPGKGRAVSIALLQSLRELPGVSAEIEQAYQGRKRLLLVDPVTLAAAAFLLLVIKLKKVHVGKDGVDVEFGETPKGALGIVRGILGM